MTLEEYHEKYNMAPFLLEEFAEGGFKVEDCDAMRIAASDFLMAKQRFEQVLSECGVEVG